MNRKGFDVWSVVGDGVSAWGVLDNLLDDAVNGGVWEFMEDVMGNVVRDGLDEVVGEIVRDGVTF
jgi:hypothetical protein